MPLKGSKKPFGIRPRFGNTQRLHDMAAAATILQRECLLSLRKHLGGVMHIFQTVICGGVFKRGVLGRCVRVLKGSCYALLQSLDFVLGVYALFFT